MDSKPSENVARPGIAIDVKRRTQTTTIIPTPTITMEPAVAINNLVLIRSTNTESELKPCITKAVKFFLVFPSNRLDRWVRTNPNDSLVAYAVAA